MSTMTDSALQPFSIQSISPPIMKGIMLKRGTIRKNWKKRFFVLERGRIVYFEPSHWLQVGERDLTDFKLVNDGMPLNINLVAPRSGSGHSLYLQTCTEDEKNVWVALIDSHITFANLITKNPSLLLEIIQNKTDDDTKRQAKSIVSVGVDDIDDGVSVDDTATAVDDYLDSDGPVPVPPVIKGWMLKQGRIVRSWRRRYFVLEQGYLRYYMVQRRHGEDDSVSFHHEKKGELFLGSYSLTCENITGVAINREGAVAQGPGHLVLRETVSQFNILGGRVLYLAADHDVDWIMWAAALGLHIGYGNSITEQRDREQREMRGRRSSTITEYIFSMFEPTRRYTLHGSEVVQPTFGDESGGTSPAEFKSSDSPSIESKAPARRASRRASAVPVQVQGGEAEGMEGADGDDVDEEDCENVDIGDADLDLGEWDLPGVRANNSARRLSLSEFKEADIAPAAAAASASTSQEHSSSASSSTLTSSAESERCIPSHTA